MDSAKTIEFNHFDVVPQASDHYYSDSNTSNKAQKKFTDQSSGSVYAHIMKEWKILKKNLPESIYVQAYETRIDLLRAVIIGSSGTPYHDGLFFFDIRLPYDYPKTPPKVYYHSHGYRLNPNLYASGKLCLSLINTWSGSKSEKWTKQSTLLQVLVSIQGLVLNEMPYFNEPGLEKGRNSTSESWVKPSKQYNEVAFILSCKSMLHIVRKPPENFESFVYQHFQSRATSILQAVKDYMMGRFLVGQFRMNGDGTCSFSSSSSLVKVSQKFQADLVLVHNELKKAFAENAEKGKMSFEPRKVENAEKPKMSFEPRKVENAEDGKEAVNTTTTTSKSVQGKQGCFMKLWDSIFGSTGKV